MKTAILFAALVFALAGHLVLAGQNFWTPLNGPFGISVLNLAATDDGQVFIYNSDQGFHRSADGGETWEIFNAGLPQDPGNVYVESLLTAPGGKVYFNCAYGIYRLNSTQTGWEVTSQLPFWSFTSRFSVDLQGRLYAWDYTGSNIVYRSSDGGDTWELLLDDAALAGLMRELFTFGNGLNFALTDFDPQRLYRFSDDGSAVALVHDSLDFRALAFHPSGKIFLLDEYDLLRSSDGGDTWDALALSSQPGVYIYNLSVLPSGGIWAWTWDGIYISTDEGDTWSFANQNLPAENFDVTHMNIAFGQDAMFAAFNPCGAEVFLRSTDWGQTWEHLENKFPYPTTTFIAKSPDDSLLVKTCRSPYLHWSQDGGNSWEPLTIQGDSLLRVFDIRSNSQGHRFAITSDAYRLYRSLDGGSTWENKTPPGAGGDQSILAISPQDELYLFTYGFNGNGIFFKSLDNGDNWQQGSNPPFYTIINKAAFHPNGSIYAMDDYFGGRLYRSPDGGLTWEIVTSEFSGITELHINSKGHIYFFGTDTTSNSGLFVSYDDFASYQLLTLNGSQPAYGNIVSDIEGDVFVADYDGVQMSQDDGATWTFLNDGISNLSSITALFMDDQQHLYCANDKDVVYRSANPVAQSNLVLGKAWYDENENCQLDAGETPLSGWIVDAGGSGHFKSTGYNGGYVLSLPPGDYSMNVSLPSALWVSNCFNDVGVSFPAGMDTAFVDFPVAAAVLCPDLEVDISTPLLRRCFENTYHVHYCNEGTQAALNATVDVTLDSFFVFNSASVPLAGQSGNVWTFSIGGVGVAECGSFTIRVTVSCEAELGQVHCVEAHIHPAPCSVASNSDAKECQANIGSFDPNDKMAFVEGLPEGERVAPNTPVEYHIRFQNTGTDTAFNIRVEDRLSIWLDPASVEPGASSHPYTWEVDGTGLLQFLFTDILLPDSNISEQASHGFVKFRVSQKTGVPLGQDIRNFASIFFDFNEPVLTNTVELEVGYPLAAGEQQALHPVLFRPNPFGEAATVEISGLPEGTPLKFLLADPTGVVRREIQFAAPGFELQAEGLQGGLYFFKIERNGERVGNGKVVVAR